MELPFAVRSSEDKIIWIKFFFLIQEEAAKKKKKQLKQQLASGFIDVQNIHLHMMISP